LWRSAFKYKERKGKKNPMTRGERTIFYGFFEALFSSSSCDIALSLVLVVVPKDDDDDE
jgi:hypothetical protein